MKKLLLLLLFITFSCGETKPVTVKAVPKVEKIKKGEIKLIKDNSDVFEVVVELNGALKIPMMLDTGCSGVSLPPYIVYTLIKIGTIKETDFLPPANYIIADGSTVAHHRLILRELKIGEYVLRDVECAMSTTETAPILLGQVVLNKFKKVTVDYKRKVLIVEK